MLTTTTQRLQAVLAEDFLEEFLHFAAAFADQRDHGDIGAGVLGDLAEQRALADAGAGENSHALAQPAGVQGVDGADAGGDGLVDVDARHRLDRAGVDAAASADGQRRLGIDGLAEAVEDAAEHAVGAVEG